jgi:Hereditary spastic paraplegia protein strumpellin
MVPAGYPESFLARLPVPHDVIGPLLSRLRSDDVYAQILHYPSPEHRSTALAQQVRVALLVGQVKLGDVYVNTTTFDIQQILQHPTWSCARCRRCLESTAKKNGLPS